MLCICACVVKHYYVKVKKKSSGDQWQSLLGGIFRVFGTEPVFALGACQNCGPPQTIFCFVFVYESRRRAVWPTIVRGRTPAADRHAGCQESEKRSVDRSHRCAAGPRHRKRRQRRTVPRCTTAGRRRRTVGGGDAGGIAEGSAGTEEQDVEENKEEVSQRAGPPDGNARSSLSRFSYAERYRRSPPDAATARFFRRPRSQFSLRSPLSPTPSVQCAPRFPCPGTLCLLVAHVCPIVVVAR